jgi:predicted nucleic acid-binding protein
MIVFIDSGVLGLLTNPNKVGIPRQCEDWLYTLLAKGVYVVSSDICDYEVRRSLLLEAQRRQNFNSVENLDNLREIIDFLKLDSAVMFKAAQVWMEARLQGKPTADNYILDVDMIIAAHWQLLREEFSSRYLVIATTNVKHLSQFAESLNWEEIQL